MKRYSISQRKKSRGNLTWYGRTYENGVLVSEISLATKRRSDAVMWLDSMNASKFMPENMFRIKENDRPLKETAEKFMETVRPPKLVKREKAFWTPAQIDAILDNAPNPEFRLFWALMAFAGLRHAEACTFGPSSIVDGRIRVVGKGNKEAFLPIGERLQREIDRVEIMDGMFSPSRFRGSNRCMDVLRDAVDKAGLDSSDANNHKFRHSFASNLLRAKVTVPSTARLMRHSSATTTLSTYSHLLQEDLKEAVDSL